MVINLLDTARRHATWYNAVIEVSDGTMKFAIVSNVDTSAP